jgi:predicted AlkP superfamily phosphohydrolase/phosphomutase
MARLLVLGLDGATFDLMLPWAKDGTLPTFSKVLGEGVWGYLDSVPNMNTAPAWTTFMTGKNPGKHGVFWFAEQGEGGPAEVKFVTAADRDAVSIWRLLSDAGRRVVVVNGPLTYPAEQVNGVMLAGFDAPSVKSSSFSYPEGLIDRLEDECGPYILHAAVAHHANAGRVTRVVEASLTAEESRVKAMTRLLETEPWDVAMYMIKATDQVAHHVWDHDAESQEPLRDVYRFADETLARLLETAGPDCDLIVMSDHGMGWRQPAAEYLSGILQQLGYLHRADASGAGSRWRVFKLAKRLGPRAKGFVKRRLPGLYRRFGFQIRFGGIDWANTRAFSDNTRSCIWVNLEGRDPHGTVAPEAYEGLVAELREVLTSLVDPETGAPVVDAVHTPDESYSGPHTAEAPDLQIDWKYDRPVAGLRYDGKLGHAVSSRFSKGFMHGLSGAHRPQGVLIFRGPSFASGERVEGAALQDLAPTILHLLEVAVPDDVDGRVLGEALAEPHASRPVVRSATHIGGPRIEQVGYSDEEAAEVEERLSALGYL